MREYLSSTVDLRGLSIFIVILLVSSVFAAAQHEKILHVFGNDSSDGAVPLGGLIADAAGNLYGTTAGAGGGFCHGTVYQLAPPVPPSGDWTETVLHSCSGSDDGDGPVGDLVFDSAGNLYGAAAYGGGSANCEGGCGVIFELMPPSEPGGQWDEAILYAFAGDSDGANPFAGVVFDDAGNLYGTTRQGGGFGMGTVFELSPPSAPGGEWTESVIHSFAGGDDGEDPVVALVVDGSGNLYGTAYQGGSFGRGVVFELARSGSGWTETVLHTFGMNQDGANPVASLIRDRLGDLAGTTQQGGTHGLGTAFGLRPPTRLGGSWEYVVLYNFGASKTDAATPEANLTLSGNSVLYGTTFAGGTVNFGTVFELEPKGGSAWRETVLYNFGVRNGDGIGPQAGVLIHNAALFGTTIGGGGFTEQGTAFSLSK